MPLFAVRRRSGGFDEMQEDGSLEVVFAPRSDTRGLPCDGQIAFDAGKPSISSLNRMKKAELVALAKERGISHSGTKAQIIDALREEE